MRTALIGLGRIGWKYHLAKIISHEDFELCAVVDTSKERLEEANQLHGVDGYTDYREMLKKAKPDLVVIASPTVFHEEQAVAAMEAGADVLLDKPMTVNYAQACHIAQVQQQTGRKLIVYQPHRYTPIAVGAKNILASGKLGQIYQMCAFSYGYSRRNDWQAFRKNGGGMLSNYGAHYIDQLLYLSGGAVKTFTCFTNRILSMGDAEDVARVLMRTETGMVLDVDINQATSQSLEGVRLFGVNGSAWVERVEGKQYFHLKYCDPATLEEKSVSEELAASGRKYPRDNVEWIEEMIPMESYEKVDFYADCAGYFKGEKPSPIPLEQTLKVMELIEKGYEQNA